MTELRIKIVNSLAAWERMAGEWNLLLNESRSNTLFLTWEWLFSWAECFLNEHRQLFVVALYDGDDLVGAAPWYINRIQQNILSIRQLEFLGSPETGADYLDVIARRGKEQKVTESLYHFLLDQGRSFWDCLLLRDIPSQSLFLLYLQDKIERDGKYAELGKGSYCPVVNLPKNGAHFSESISPKRRARFRQDLGRLQKNGDTKHETVSEDAVLSGIDDFFAFYSAKSGHEGGGLQRFIRTFAGRSANQNRLQIDLLRAEGRTIAGLMHFRYRDELLLYLMAVDKEFNPKISAGNVLVGLCLDQACAQDVSRYDFLKGYEQYKFYWADSGRSSLSIFMAQKKFTPVLLTTGRFIKYTAKILLR